MAALLQELSESQLRRALTVVSTLADESAEGGSFIEGALGRLTSLVPSDLTTLSLCDLERGTRTVFARRNEALSEDDRSAFNRHFRQHPLVRFHGSHPRGPTQRISDCLDIAEFRNSPLYADYYRRIGIKHVMALPLRIDEHNVISIVFNRSSSDFKNNERALLEGVRPAGHPAAGGAIVLGRLRRLHASPHPGLRSDRQSRRGRVGGSNDGGTDALTRRWRCGSRQTSKFPR